MTPPELNTLKQSHLLSGIKIRTGFSIG